MGFNEVIFDEVSNSRYFISWQNMSWTLTVRSQNDLRSFKYLVKILQYVCARPSHVDAT